MNLTLMSRAVVRFALSEGVISRRSNYRREHSTGRLADGKFHTNFESGWPDLDSTVATGESRASTTVQQWRIAPECKPHDVYPNGEMDIILVAAISLTNRLDAHML